MKTTHMTPSPILGLAVTQNSKRSRLHAWSLAGVLVASVVGLAPNAGALLTPKQEQLRNFDLRRPQNGGTPSSATQVAAVARLRSQLPGVRVSFDPLLGTPRLVSADNGFLTGAEGEGNAVPAPAAAGFSAAAPHRTTRAFLEAHHDLFGCGPEALDSARINRDYITAHNGLRTTVWQQSVAGIPVFDALLIAHVTAKGELVKICSGFLPDPVRAASPGAAPGTPLAATPGIPAPVAAAAAAHNVGDEVTVSEVTVEGEVGAGAEAAQQLIGRAWLGAASARLTWLPMQRDALRLCWEVVLTSRSRGEMFRLLVDARSAEVLFRQCLTAYTSDATYRVFTNDSPSPFSPGHPTPLTEQPPVVARGLVTLGALDTNASPAGWIADGNNETRGNNVDAHTDWDANNSPDLPRPQGSPPRVFDFPQDLSTQAPQEYASAAVAQLFYLCNWMHDRLYQLGFTEAAGNFQVENFGRGGNANDPVQADAQDGGGFNNANFSTPPDGSSGRMQMYLWNRPVPVRDGSLDGEIVLHEYTHGLSWRLAAGGMNLGTLQANGMGEGWSDFYPLALLSQPGDDVDGCYAAGAYASYLIGGSSDMANYYFGIRRYPYSTDMAKNPLTFNDIDPDQADNCSSGAPYHTAMFGTCSASSASEVHNQGEVWCALLWEARANLICKHGWAVGNELMLQLVTDGLRLCPPQPNFVEARDAILEADVVQTGGANRMELWRGFAKRGLGVGATSPVSTSTADVVESFDLPDDLRVAPVTGFTSYGPKGGPFSQTCATYYLTNTGAAAMDWTAWGSQSWVVVSPGSGRLAAGAVTSISLCLHASATNLALGTHSAQLVISNTTSRQSFVRSVALEIMPPPIWLFTLDQDPGWTRQGEWAFGQPVGGGASMYGHPDPANGFTGTNVFGVNLRGDYEVEIGAAQYLTAGPFDCSGYTGTRLQFRRWLNCDFAPYVYAAVEVSYDGAHWYSAWSNSSGEVADSRWRRVWVDVSAYADGQSTVYVRWKHQVGREGAWAYSGWNLDDVELLGTPTRALNVLLPGKVTEGAGTMAGAGLLRLSSPLSSNLVVSLTSDAPAKLQVPASVTIPAGVVSNLFTISVPDNGVNEGDVLVTVTASTPALGSISTWVTVADDDLPPTIATQPISRTIPQGSNVTFSVVATGKAPLKYFWRLNGSLLTGATASSYTQNSVALAQSGNQYACLVSNQFGTELSSAATLTVVPGGALDVAGFDDLPGSDARVPQGYHDVAWDNFYYTTATGYGASGYQAGMVSASNVAFNAYASPASITNQSPFHLLSAYLTGAWNDGLRVRARGYAGDTLLYDNTYTLSATNPTLINFGYLGVTRVKFSSSGGTPYYSGYGTHFAIDDVGLLGTPTPPSFVSQPFDQTVRLGATATFTVSVAGSRPLVYQWRRNGTPISGATSQTYSLVNAQFSDAGALFSCAISNAFGAITSAPARLRVVGELYSFSGFDGGMPSGELAQDAEGNLYGTTQYGGSYSRGTVFRVDRSGTLTTLHSFDSTTGAYPQAGLIRGLDGYFYGTTTSGGANGYGTLFRLTTNGALSTLAAFTYQGGYYPRGGLLQLANGDLYGTTASGGSNYNGSVFRCTTNGALSSIGTFPYSTNGYSPQSGLALGADGALYGTTRSGGPGGGQGTVFRITTNGSMTRLATFYGTNGSSPSGRLALGDDGQVYGTTYSGGSNYYGTVFRVSTNAMLTTVAAFGYSVGAYPETGLRRAANGSFYGTARSGGYYGRGTVFQISLPGTIAALMSFDGTNGIAPQAVPAEGADGSLYVTAAYGGPSSGGASSSGNGTVVCLGAGPRPGAPAISQQPHPQIAGVGAPATFAVRAQGSAPLGYTWRRDGVPIATATQSSFTLSAAQLTDSGAVFSCAVANGTGTVTSVGAKLTVVPPSASGAFYAFSGSDGGPPVGALVQAADGNFYGVTQYGGASGMGTIFSVNASGQMTIVVSFGQTNGAYPAAGLMVASDGNMYGTTSSGGANYDGTAFRLGTNGVLTTLVSFDYPAGYSPQSRLIQASDGNLYGTTAYGGSQYDGTVYRLSMSGTLTYLASLDEATTGYYPNGLVQGPDGSLYGTAAYGGTNYDGTIFRVTPDGILTTVKHFYYSSSGEYPRGDLILAADGRMYGTTQYGGSSGNGTVFAFTTNGVFSTVAAFTSGSSGYNPLAGVIQGTDGNLYGVASGGGTYSAGVAFRLPLGGTLTNLYSFDGTNGARPQGALFQAADGKLYGVAYAGGQGWSGSSSSGNGTTFRLNLGLTNATTVDHFTWSPIPTTQTVNEYFPVTIQARTVMGQIASNFTGTVNLRDAAGMLATNNLLGTPSGYSYSYGDYTLGQSFTPNRTMTVTHFRHFFGYKVSLWTDGGTLLATRGVASTPGTWTETPLTTPVQLQAGMTYRLAAYTSFEQYYWMSGMGSTYPDGMLGQAYYSSGDAFPTSTWDARWVMVDLRYTTGSATSVPVTPTLSGAFVRGTWTGTVKITQPATNLVIRALDAQGHFGDSNPIQVRERLVPTVSSARFGQTMVLYWPVNAPGYHLEFTPTLSPAQWLPVPEAPLQIGEYYVAPMGMSAPSGFYRLRQASQ